MAATKQLIKKRVITLAITLGLFILYVVIGNLYLYGYVDSYPQFTRAMLVVTMIQVLGGCIIQTLGKTKAALVLSTIVFLALCVFLFYSTKWYDFVTFALCMYLVLHRSSHMCDSLCGAPDPTNLGSTETEDSKNK